MYKPIDETSAESKLLARCETLYSYLVVVGWRNPRCTEIQDAKTILMTMIEAERISFDLMQEVIEALDTAQALYIDAAKLYSAAWDVFIDIPIPFLPVDAPPALNNIIETSYAAMHDDTLSHEQQRLAALDYLAANVELAERAADD